MNEIYLIDLGPALTTLSVSEIMKSGFAQERTFFLKDFVRLEVFRIINEEMTWLM